MMLRLPLHPWYPLNSFCWLIMIICWVCWKNTRDIRRHASGTSVKAFSQVRSWRLLHKEWIDSHDILFCSGKKEEGKTNGIKQITGKISLELLLCSFVSFLLISWLLCSAMLTLIWCTAASKTMSQNNHFSFTLVLPEYCITSMKKKQCICLLIPTLLCHQHPQDKMLMLLPDVISSRVFEIPETSPNQNKIHVIFLLKNITVSLLPLLSLYCLTIRKSLQSNSSMDKIT